MFHRFDAEVAILGMGSAGLLTAFHLSKNLRDSDTPKQVVLVGRMSGGSSVLSSWYVAQYDPSRLRERLIAGLGNAPTQEQIRLVSYIAEKHVEETERFKVDVVENAGAGGVKQFVDGFSGIKALTGYSTRQSLPGNKILRYLHDQMRGLHVHTVVANIEDLERIGGGYRVFASHRDESLSFTARRLVIATGGMAHTHQIATSAKAEIANVLELARDRLGIAVTDLDRAVFFPFALREHGYRAGSLLPPSFMTRADVFEERADGTLVDLLSDRLKAAVASGDYRPQFAELVALFRKVRSTGAKVVVQTRMSREEFGDYVATDHYGYVFSDKTYEQALSLSVAPAYHSALGGIVVDSKCASTDPRVFAVGEAALVYGTDRPIGGEHVSAITLSRLVARVISEQLIAERTAAGALASGEPSRAKALGAVRTLLDHHDEAIVANLESADGGDVHLLASRQRLEEFVLDVFSRVAWRVRSPKLKKAFSRLTDDAVGRILNYELADGPSVEAWPVERVVAQVDALGWRTRERVLNALAERLSIVELVAPIKQRLGESVRDRERESQVVSSAVKRTDCASERGWVEGLYRGIVLPASFEFQHIFRGLHSMERRGDGLRAIDGDG